MHRATRARRGERRAISTPAATARVRSIRGGSAAGRGTDHDRLRRAATAGGAGRLPLAGPAVHRGGREADPAPAAAATRARAAARGLGGLPGRPVHGTEPRRTEGPVDP